MVPQGTLGISAGYKEMAVVPLTNSGEYAYGLRFQFLDVQLVSTPQILLEK